MDTKVYNFKFLNDPSQTDQKSADQNLVLALAAVGAIKVTGDYMVAADGTVTATRGGSSGNGCPFP